MFATTILLNSQIYSSQGSLLPQLNFAVHYELGASRCTFSLKSRIRALLWSRRILIGLHFSIIEESLDVDFEMHS
jgi:hypothetical protein